MNRFEEIKNMNMDEMVRFIDHIASEDYCDRAVCETDNDGEIVRCLADDCTGCIKKWLMKEAKQKKLFEREMPELVQECLELNAPEMLRKEG